MELVAEPVAASDLAFRRFAGMPLQQMARGFFIVAAAACAAVSLLFFAAIGRDPQMLWTGLAFVMLGLALAACGWLSMSSLRTAATGLLALVVVVVAGSALALGWGLAAPGLPVLGLMVLALSAAAGWRQGALLALVAALALAVVAYFGPLPLLQASTTAATTPPGPPTLTPLLQLGTHLITLVVGLACGAMISQVMARYMGSAKDRERRFRHLLALAADAYWELDHNYRLVSASIQDKTRRNLFDAGALGQVPWDLKGFGCASEVLDELLADLDARQPFRDRAITFADRDGVAHAFMVSGEPRFDTRGVFTGYWGVARDVTEMQAARAALVATETRYQELFSRIPTPLVLHHGHRVLDANPAALTMFGHADLGAMMGSDLHSAFEGGDSRERARRRVEQLMSQPVGTALPVSDFKLRVQHGAVQRQMAVRATGVRVDAAATPAVLTIFVDDTDRLTAEEAVRRSEAMLAHLVATSPDLITLTDLASGRFAMVNQTFERVTGWTAAEAVGKTSIELGVWHEEAARQRFADAVSQQGQITDLPVQFVNKGGQSIPMLVSAARFVMDRRDYIVVNARDVSERERLRLEREAILTNISIGIAVTRGDVFVLVNPHFEKIFGWAPGTLLGQSSRVVISSDEEAAQLTQALGRGEAVDLETAGRRADGSHFVAHVRGRAIDRDRPIEGGTAWIVEDVTERRQSATALARARDDAEAASRAKSAFLANTSHELRTPLNGLIGLATLARAGDISEVQRRAYVDQIAESAQALSLVISDILDVSKIEAGKLLLDTSVFNLGELLQTLQATYRPLAQAKGLTLSFDVEPDVVGAACEAVQGDPVRVRQVLSNFLSNALKFTEQGSIGVAVRRHGPRVRFEVRDTGPGIAAQVQARLFMPFTQGDQSTTRRYGGTGLGLSISRELATLMGGEVGVDSVPDRGSCFWAELPLPVSNAPDATPLLGHGAHLRGARVLMVEDNPVNMLIAVAMLERWGVQVEQAHDGAQAVAAVNRAAAQGTPFDAVLMDVQMPVMSGHEATRLLRGQGGQGGNGSAHGGEDAGAAAAPGHPSLPIIALTAAALVSERDEALRAGMNDFLTKPIDPDRLHNTLLRWCGR